MFWVLQYCLGHKTFLSAVSRPIAQTTEHDGIDSQGIHELIKCVPCKQVSLDKSICKDRNIKRKVQLEKKKLLWHFSEFLGECYQA